eukprot:scaffold48_cov395-Prasinococcus_capsulatus_cf.AAC.31
MPPSTQHRWAAGARTHAERTVIIPEVSRARQSSRKQLPDLRDVGNTSPPPRRNPLERTSTARETRTCRSRKDTLAVASSCDGQGSREPRRLSSVSSGQAMTPTAHPDGRDMRARIADKPRCGAHAEAVGDDPPIKSAWARSRACSCLHGQLIVSMVHAGCRLTCDSRAGHCEARRQAPRQPRRLCRAWSARAPRSRPSQPTRRACAQLHSRARAVSGRAPHLLSACACACARSCWSRARPATTIQFWNSHRGRRR